MNKRHLLAIIIIFFSLAVIAGISQIQTISESIATWDTLYISDKDYQAISTSTNLSGVPLTTEIYFDDQHLLYDENSNTFYYSLIEDSPSAYTPVIELADNTISAAVYGEAISMDMISSNRPIKLVLMRGNTASISDLICTTLPIMNIDIAQDIIDANGYDDTFDIAEYVPSAIYLFDNRADFDGKTRSVVSDSKIRRRGQTNLANPAKGYRITLLEDKNDMDGERNKENLLGLRNDDDWILYNAYRDYEKIRNVFSMNLWHDSFKNANEWQVDNSTEYRYLELFINNHYHGLYAICYPIDSKQVKITDGESLFKKMDWTHSERDTKLTLQGNGEYTLPGYVNKSTEYNYNDLLSLYVNMTYSTDPVVTRMTSDVTNSIDLWLYYKLTQAVDNVANGGAKNMYVSVKNSSSGIEGHKLLFTPWDMDQSWRHVGEGTLGQYKDPGYDMPIDWGTVYCLQNINDPTIDTQIKARYQELREGPWSDTAMMEALNRYEADIYGSGAFMRTMNRWPEALYNNPSTGLGEFKDYVLNRLKCMDEYILD